MKKILILFLLLASVTFGQYDYPTLWKLSGLTLSPISSTWSLSGITNITTTGTYNLSDGTDTYKLLVSSDKFTLQNDAASPFTLMTTDSAGATTFFGANPSVSVNDGGGDIGAMRVLSGNIQIGSTSHGWYAITGGTSRWQFVHGGEYNLQPMTNNTYDIGGTSNLIRTGYFGTSLVLGASGSQFTQNITSNKWTLQNDAGSPASLLTVDSLGNQIQLGNLRTQSSLITDERVVTLADSASITIATGVAGWGKVMIGDNQQEADITWKADGAVTLVRNTAGVASDGTTDDALNIYDGGSGIIIKNLLNATLKCAISLKYYTP